MRRTLGTRRPLAARQPPTTKTPLPQVTAKPSRRTKAPSPPQPQAAPSAGSAQDEAELADIPAKASRKLHEPANDAIGDFGSDPDEAPEPRRRKPHSIASSADPVTDDLSDEASPVDRPPSPGASSSTARDIARQRVFETQLWIDKYRPATENELGLHKRKLRDLRDRLVRAFSDVRAHAPESGGRCGRLLVLTGPSGAAKTAALRVLSRELDFDIAEWENPVNTNPFESVWNRHERSSSDGAPARFGPDYVPVMLRFQEFVASATKAATLSFSPVGPPLGGTNALNVLGTSALQQHLPPLPASAAQNARRARRKIVLIEDWPPLGSPSSRAALHHSLRLYMASTAAVFPLVLIISDVSDVHLAGGSGGGPRDGCFTDSPVTVRSVIPPDIAAMQSYTNIAFNPVAPTILAKVLTRIADIEFHAPSRRARRPSKAVLDWIAKTSSGDIRHAIHRLQFLALADLAAIPSTMAASMDSASRLGTQLGHSAVSQTQSALRFSQRQSSGRTVRASLDDADCRDETVSIFQAVGRIRYNKRLDSMSMSELMLSSPQHDHHRRLKLEIEPESLFDLMHIDHDAFVLFAEQNTLPCYDLLEQLVAATSYLSDSDLLVGRWENRRHLTSHATSVCARGLLFSHGATSPGTRLEPPNLDHVDLDPFAAPESLLPYSSLSAMSSSFRDAPAAHAAASSTLARVVQAPKNTFQQLTKPEAWACRLKARDNRMALQFELARDWVQQCLKLEESEYADHTANTALALSRHHMDSVLWLEILPFLGILGRTNRFPPVRTLPVYAKSALAGVCSFGPRSVADWLHEGAYDGGIEYLDAIEDPTTDTFVSTGRPSIFASTPGKRSASKSTWQDHMSLRDDDIDKFSDDENDVLGNGWLAGAYDLAAANMASPTQAVTASRS
ncbi:RFC checkpoint protein Rad17 [Polyrhizophydium stewartii]|uniref:RFC checkpoint protein Rad17 n=1 Tax=Polyrhizophydium stewartii TaxID=2732419 RepID=A0ABR4N5R5_9FUNG